MLEARWTQNPAPARACRFDSDLRHHGSNPALITHRTSAVSSPQSLPLAQLRPSELRSALPRCPWAGLAALQSVDRRSDPSYSTPAGGSHSSNLPASDPFPPGRSARRRSDTRIEDVAPRPVRRGDAGLVAPAGGDNVRSIWSNRTRGAALPAEGTTGATGTNGSPRPAFRIAAITGDQPAVGRPGFERGRAGLIPAGARA